MRCRLPGPQLPAHTAGEFGATTDEFALNANARELPLIHTDPYLNNLLLKYCEAALADRRGNVSQLRTRVENAISSLLPHGRVVVDDVARSLAMSKRTLARKLSDEGLNFAEVLQQLRRDLAVRYLDDPKLHIFKIAWLLGFNDLSAFTHAFKRWTGKRRARCEQPASIEQLWPRAALLSVRQNLDSRPPHPNRISDFRLASGSVGQKRHIFGVFVPSVP